MNQLGQQNWYGWLVAGLVGPSGLGCDGHGRYVRLAFLTGKPAVVLFGLCLGDLSP